MYIRIEFSRGFMITCFYCNEIHQLNFLSQISLLQKHLHYCYSIKIRKKKGIIVLWYSIYVAIVLLA